MIHPARKIPETSVYGNISLKNANTVSSDIPKRYRFCGFPIGVNILPRFAASVCIMITRSIHFLLNFSSILCMIVIVNGTNVISATSFVITMDKKKQRKTRTNATPATVLVRASSFSASRSKNPSFRKPATTVIRQNKTASVRKSIYPGYCASG